MKTGITGINATILQISVFMWMRTILNYQYYYGGSFLSISKILYKEGKIKRFYQGFSFSLIHGSICRFGDIAFNTGVIEVMNLDPSTTDLSLSTKTFCGSLLSGVWRVVFSPIEVMRNSLQINGKQGLHLIREKIKNQGLKSLYHGSVATYTTSVLGHYPWFMTYNYLDQYFNTNYKSLSKKETMIKNGFIGFTASIITDIMLSSLQIIRTIKQVNQDNLSYNVIIKQIIKKDGISGLFGRGLRTRLLFSGLQGTIFTISWNMFLGK
jgi:hypothetical protein